MQGNADNKFVISVALQKDISPHKNAATIDRNKIIFPIIQTCVNLNE